MTDFGYGGSILTINVSSGMSSVKPSAPYTSKYLGGHGVAARLYWELVPPEADAFDADNAFIAASGPVAGFPGLSGFRWKVFSKSPAGERNVFSHANLGERWGAWLKYAGYDALVIHGKAAVPSFIYINDDQVEVREATHLWGLSTFDTIDALKQEVDDRISVLAIGPAGENLIPFATVFSDAGASGSGGLGAVLGSKNIKAVAVLGSQRPVAADPERLQELVKKFNVPLPMPDMINPWEVPGITRPGACFGCGSGCTRQIYDGEDGRVYKSLCQASAFYMEALPPDSNEPPDTRLLATRLCDGNGLDTVVMDPIIAWLAHCYRNGILTDESTGLELSGIGGAPFIRDVIDKIVHREGLGELLAQGVIPAATALGPETGALLGKFVATINSEKRDYDPRITMTTALLYATEPRRPIQQLHEIAMPTMMWMPWATGDPKGMLDSKKFRAAAARMWGSEIAADFSTYEGKALAAKKCQDRVYAKESLVLCDLKWTGTLINRNEDSVTEAQVYSAITGNEITEEELYRYGERSFNVQRAILLRQGWQGREDDKVLDYLHTEPIEKNSIFFNLEVLVPGRDGEVTSRAGEVLDRDKFEEMKTEYYQLRGWDPATGYPTRAKLEELGLADVAADLGERGLLG